MPALGYGAMAAHQPLELWILVRIQVPQPDTSANADIFLKQDLRSAGNRRINPVFVPRTFLFAHILMCGIEVTI